MAKQKDITHFVDNCNLKRSVLVFPPLLSHYRFLTHQIVQEDFLELASFSVGEGDGRQTIVCSIHLRSMQRESQRGRATSGMSSNPERNDRFAKPSRGKGRGRGTKHVCQDEGSNVVEPQLPQTIDKEHGTASCQKPDDEKQRKKSKDKTRKSRKPDQDLYVPKSRKPDQAMYVPRSQRNQENKPTPISKTDIEATGKTEVVERPVKRLQYDKVDPPPKKKTVAKNESQTMAAVDMETTNVQECKVNVGSAGTSEHLEDLTSSSNCTNIQDVLQQEMPSQEASSQEVSLHCDDEGMTSVSGENDEPVSSVNNELSVEEKQNNKIKDLGVNSQDQSNDISMCKTSSADMINGHKCTEEKVSNSVDEHIESREEQIDLDEDHSAINVENPQSVEEKEKHILKETKISESHEKDEPTIEGRVDLEKKDNLKEDTFAVSETSMVTCSGEDNAATVPASDDLAADDGDDWEALFDDSGDALAGDVMDEISEAIGNVKVSVKKTKQDYYNYHAKDNFDYGQFSHVIEIYDFPAEFKTADLIQSFSGYRIKGFDIHWVDDTHALGIFSCPSTAQDALGLQNPMLRTRSLNQATRESKLKARNFVDLLQPSKPRPETSASAARRLVSGALGIKSKESKEQKAAEIKKLRDAKEKKKADKRLTEDVWEGNTWRL